MPSQRRSRRRPWWKQDDGYVTTLDPFIDPPSYSLDNPAKILPSLPSSDTNKEANKLEGFEDISTEDILALAGDSPVSPPSDFSSGHQFSPPQLSTPSHTSSPQSAPPPSPPRLNYEDIKNLPAGALPHPQRVAEPVSPHLPSPKPQDLRKLGEEIPTDLFGPRTPQTRILTMAEVAQQLHEKFRGETSQENFDKAAASLRAFEEKMQAQSPLARLQNAGAKWNNSQATVNFTPVSTVPASAEQTKQAHNTDGAQSVEYKSLGIGDSKHAGQPASNTEKGTTGSAWWSASAEGGWKPTVAKDTGMDTTSSSQPSSTLLGTATNTSTNAAPANLFGGGQATASSASASNGQFPRISAPNPPASQPNLNSFGSATSSAGGGPFGSGTASSSGSNGGLFGTTNAQSSQPPSNSLFANAGQSSSAGATGGLFGSATNTTDTSAQSSSNAFPTLGATSMAPQQPSNSLFAPKSQAQTGGGLFGSTNQSTQPSGGSLFGSSTQTAQPGGGGGLFGNANQTSRPSGGNLSGSTTQPSQSAGGNLFSNTLGGGTTSQTLGATGQQTSQQLPQQNGQVSKNAAAPRAALFDDLLERGRKRRDFGGAEPGQLPSLQLGLGDISSKIKGLGNNKPDFNASRAHDGRAHYLLAASGIQQGTTRKDLEALANESAAMQSQIAPQDDPRIENYMASMHAKTLREMMDDAMEQSKRDFDNFLEDNLQINWDYQRKRVYEHLGLVKPGDQEDQQSDRVNSLSVGARGAFGRSFRRSRAPDTSMRGSMRGPVRDSPMSKSVLGGPIGRGSTLRQSLFKDVEEKAAESGGSAIDDVPFQRTTIERYGGKVKDLNVARMEDVVFPVIEQFARVELEGGSETPKHLISAYHALRNIVKENSNVERPADEGAIRERQYLQDYVSNNSNTGASVRLRQQIVDGSLKYLEQNFLNKVQDAVDRNPQEANIGGMPTKTSVIRGYLRIREASRDLLPEDQEPQRGEDGEPIWATVFFLIRSGLVDEAAQYVVDNERVIKTYDRSFPQYMASYASQGRNISYSLRSRMTREYQQRLSNPAKVNDPYRMACYKILGRCDLSHPKLDIPHPEMEDVIWLYFALAREANRAEETAGETLCLENVQGIVADIKERLFASTQEQSDGAYATCFLLQVLTGTFELAIAYLYQFNQPAAVHFAIALDFYGLLRVSDPLLDMDLRKYNALSNVNFHADVLLVSYTTRQQPQINFARMLGYYTQSFRLARPEAAADYLILISVNADLPGEMGQKMGHVTHEALKELTLETREFPLLIGDIRNDGHRIKGVIETRLPLVARGATDPAAFLRTLTIQAAQTADDAGRVNDAVLLYHLAEEYDSVITVVNRALSDALSIDISAEPMRLQPLKPRTKPDEQQQHVDQMSSLSLVAVDDPAMLAQNMLALYNTHALYFSRISELNRQSAALLLRVWEVRSRIAAQHWAESIDTLILMDLLPMRAAGNISSIRAAAAKLNQQPPVVARNVGNLLVWAIGACGEQRRTLLQGGFEVTGGRGRETERELKQCAKDLMVFAGLVRYRIGGDVYEVLARAGEGLEQ